MGVDMLENVYMYVEIHMFIIYVYTPNHTHPMWNITMTHCFPCKRE